MELSINEKIKILCKRRGLSVRQLAKKLNKSAANLYQQLDRDNFRIEDLKKICDILDCDLVVDIVERDGGDVAK